MARYMCLLLVLPMCYAVSDAIPDNIIHPCNNNDEECVRENLAANSQCNQAVAGIVPSEFTISSFLFETPYFNATYIDNNLIVRNLDKCFVSQFFYNMEKDNSVLAVTCRGLQFESSRVLIQHYAGGEDTTYAYDYIGTYPEIILTINLRPANAMDLCKNNAFAYVSALPNYSINPKDKKTATFLTTDQSYLFIFERESTQDRANMLLRNFVNSRLCNFGCNV